MRGGPSPAIVGDAPGPPRRDGAELSAFRLMAEVGLVERQSVANSNMMSHMTAFLRHWLRTACLLLCLAASAPALAQWADEAPAEISAAEREQLRALLEAPIEPGQTSARLTEVYIRKADAARRLGDNVTLIRLLREWSATDIVAKRMLRSALSGTDDHEEALRLGEELVAAERNPFINAATRLALVRDYSLIGRTDRARFHIDAAEALVNRDIARSSLGGEGLFYVRRVQALFHQSKSVLMKSTGQWVAGIEQAKLAVERGKQMYEARGLVRDRGAAQEALNVYVRSYVDLARQQTDAGLYADAEWNLREAYRLAQRAGVPEAQIWGLYRFVAEYYAAAGQFKDAQVFVDRAVTVSEPMGYSLASAQRRAIEGIRIQSLIGQGRWAEARRTAEALDAALKARGAPPLTAAERRIRTLIALNTGGAGFGVPTLQASLAQSERTLGPDHYFVAQDRGLLAATLAAGGELAAAKPLFEQALRGLTAPAALTGDFTESATQRLTKRYILRSYMKVLAAGAQANPQDAIALFEVADQLGASGVQQALAEAAVRAGVSTPGLAEIVRKEQDAKNEVAALSAQVAGQGGDEARRLSPQMAEQMRARIRELEALRRTLKAQIQKDFPDYFQLVQPKSPSPLEIARQLRPGELFLAVVPMADTTYAWAIDAQGGIRFHDAGINEAQLGELVTKVRRTLDIGGFENGRIPAFAFVDAHRIYQSIFAPFDAQIEGKRQLVVSAGGALAQLPFAVLPRKVYAGSLQDAPWLLRDVAVSHVPSASGWLALKRLQKLPSAAQPMLAWGDPLFDLGARPAAAEATQVAASGDAAPVVRKVLPTRSVDTTQRNVMDPDTYVVYSKIPPLPETRDEVQALARILGADAAQDLVLGDKATRQSVLDANRSGALAKKRVVVFATHGLLAGDLPDLNQPALAMAANADAKASPLLTLEDVLGLKLNADWVVLSACNTAGADGRAQEALSGLARGFFYAGSRSLLVTHWSVESQSAMLLTTNTFDAYAKDPAITRAEALRQAMLKVMAQSQYQHPAFWAPYALVGEGGR